MRSISRLVFLAIALLTAGAATVAPAQNGEAPAPEVTPHPTVALAPSAVSVDWAWIAPGAGGAGERLVFEPPLDLEPPAERLGTIRFRYDGEETAGALEIEFALPPDLDYVTDSATGPGAETAYDEDAHRVRWVVPGPLEPGTVGLVSFRARPRPPELVPLEDAGETP